MRLSKFQQKWCTNLVSKLCEKPISKPFQEEMSKKYGIPGDIKRIIAYPIDLSTISKKLADKKYKNLQEWEYDMKMVWANAQLLFHTGNAIYEMSKDCSEWFEKKLKDMPRSSSEKWLKQFNKTHQKLQELVDSYPKDRSTRTNDALTSRESPSRLLADPSSQKDNSSHHHEHHSHSQHSSQKASQNNSQLSDDIEDENEGTAPQPEKREVYRAVAIAEDPRSKEKKTKQVNLFDDLD